MDASRGEGHDVWVVAVTGDPGRAVEQLAAATGDLALARDAVRSPPLMVHAGLTRAKADAFIRPLAGLFEFEIRAARRARPVAPAQPTAAPAHAPQPKPEPDAPIEVGDEEIAYSAALTASFAYALQWRVLGAAYVAWFVLVLLLTPIAYLMPASASMVTSMAATMLVLSVPLALFAVVVQLTLRGEDRFSFVRVALPWGSVLTAGLRYVLVTCLAVTPAVLVLAAGDVHPDVAAITTPVGAVIMLVVLFVLPGSYAFASVGVGWSGINPFSGVTLALRVPGAYVLTLLYIYAFSTFASALATLAIAGAWLLFTLNPIAALAVMLVVYPLLLLPLVVAGRALGLLIRHHERELGL